MIDRSGPGRRRAGRVRRVLVLAPLLALAFPVPPLHAAEIGPNDNLCAAIEALQPGDELLLGAGDYKAGCTIRRGGRPDSPVTIAAADPTHRPRLVYPGQPVNMLEIRASDVVIRGLDFWGAMADADGVRIISGNRITVEDCRFTQLGGIAIAATHTSVRALTVRRNAIFDSNSTGMYFGCHEGLTCVISGLVVEGNYIRSVSAPHPQIGYGLQVKLNSSAVIRDNVILDTKGPGIMVYGSTDLTTTTVVERNFTRGSRTSSGIVLGGGPAIVRNNLSAGNFEAGIGLENYGHRNLLRAITVIYNSVYGNGQGGITVPESGPIEAAIFNNAAHARAGTSALPSPRAGIRLGGNRDCSWGHCFTSPEEMDFSPFAGSLLIGSSVPTGGDTASGVDFFGLPRQVPASVGAVERPHSAVQLGVPQ